MNEDYKTALSVLIDTADEDLRDLVCKLAATKTDIGYCPKALAELINFCKTTQTIFGAIADFDRVKELHGAQVSFGRTPR